MTFHGKNNKTDKGTGQFEKTAALIIWVQLQMLTLEIKEWD